MENNPVAPAAPAEPAAPVSETTPTNSNAPAAPAAPATPVANIPADKIEAFNKFIDANGGYDKAFAKLKSDVSTPATQPQQMVQQAPQQAPQQMAQYDQQQMAQQLPQYQQPQRLPDGYVTPEEMNIKRFYDDLARDPGYAPIKEEISSGEIFKTLNKYGIRPAVNGAINVGQVKDFLDMYAKSKAPAIAPSAPVTSTPTVDYVNVGKEITSRDDAMAVLRQNMQLGGSAANHPQTEAAKAFLKNYFKK